MVLTRLKDIGTKLTSDGKHVRYSTYHCSYCRQEVDFNAGQAARRYSCGCVPISKFSGKRNTNYRHGGIETDGKYRKLYLVWADMKARCLRNTHQRYEYYGGRGINLYREWHKFKPFKDWALQAGYKQGLTIDRINNDGNYEPNNCRWVTSLVNVRNSPQTIINTQKARRIKYLLAATNLKVKDIAWLLNVSIHIVSDISRDRTWRDVKI